MTININWRYVLIGIGMFCTATATIMTPMTDHPALHLVGQLCGQYANVFNGLALLHLTARPDVAEAPKP